MSEDGRREPGVGSRGLGVDIPTPDARIPGVGWVGWGTREPMNCAYSAIYACT